MKNKLFILSIIIPLFIFTSCNIDEDQDCRINSSKKINIITEIENPYSKLRSSKSGFSKDDNIGIYLMDYKTTSPSIGTISHFMNTEYVYDGTYWSSKEGTDLFLQTIESKGDIYAYSPFDYEMSRDPKKKNLRAYPFKVEADQSLSSQNSDFLWAKQTGISIENTTAKLVFKHLLSKVILNVTYGSLGNNYKSIMIHNLTREAFIDMQTGSVTKTGSNSNIKPYIKDFNNLNFDKTLSAIIIPQTVEAGTTLFSITIDGQTYGYILNETVWFESGMAYTFNLIIGDAHSRTNNKSKHSQTKISLVDKSFF